MGHGFISSRTPEGIPNRCPVCGSDVCIEPSLLCGDAPCPRCGTLLWFLNLADKSIVVERESSEAMRQRVTRLIAEQLGVEPESLGPDVQFVNDLGADSLDMVDLVMELEEEFDLP